MKKHCMFSIGLLFLWFTTDMTGIKIGKITLVETAWNSIDGILWLIFLVLSILFIYKVEIGKYLLLIFISLWATIQFYSHWYYTIFGVSNEKLSSYNEFFKDTYHLIPASDQILIPDFYHIILHLLILVSLFYLFIFTVQAEKE